MDKDILQSIKVRKDAFFASFNVSAEAQKKIDALFEQIEKLAQKCKNVTEFEAEFNKSPLNQKYLDLFTEIATKCAPKVAAAKANISEIGKTITGGVAAGVADSALDQAIDNVVPTRAAVHQKIYDEARKIPGVGDAIDTAEKAGYAGHLAKLFKKKK